MFEEKTIIITGGSSGVGKVLAQRLAMEGANIALIARDGQKLASVVEDIRSIGSSERRFGGYCCDVGDADAVEETIGRIGEDFGAPHILINSAGVLREGYFEHQDNETFREVMDINFFGTVHCTRTILPYLKYNGGGRIVNMCSVAGLMGVFGYTAYCASKHAVRGFTDALRAELKPKNIQLHLVCPPEFESPMVEALSAGRTPENVKIVHTIPPTTADVVAKAVIKGIEQNRYEIIPSIAAQAVSRMNQWLPGIGRAIVDLQIKRHYRGPDEA